MKILPILRPLTLWLVLCCLSAACSHNEDEGLAPFHQTTAEGEACTLQINMTRGGWRIASVTNLDGEPMKDANQNPLQLDGTGELNYQWWNLKRETDTRLILHFEENFDPGDCRYLVLNLEMKNGIYRERITIAQKACRNFYDIESIAYTLEEGDGIIKDGTERFGFYFMVQSGKPVEEDFDIYPFASEYTRYYFRFDDFSTRYFTWINPESLYINLPDSINDGKVIVADEDFLPFKIEGKYIKDNVLKNKKVTTKMVPTKWNGYFADIYYRQLRTTFRLTLAKKGCDVKRVFKGKLVQRYPYDCSSIRHEVKDTLD